MSNLVSVLDVSIIVLTSLSVFFDVTARRIPNWLIVSGVVTAIFINGLQGFSQLSKSLLGLFLGMAVFMIPFALRSMGAGDVKYFGVVGALVGVQWLPRILFYSSIAAGLIAVICLIVARLDFTSLRKRYLNCKVAVMPFGRVLPDSLNIRTVGGGYSVPWGVAIGMGTIVAYYLDPSGQWAGF